MLPRKVVPTPEDPSQDSPEVRDRRSGGRDPTLPGSENELEAKKQRFLQMMWVLIILQNGLR